jgi:O-antigen/teichoic acid export membrane protein
VAFGSIAVGKEVLTLLASSKYADAADLLLYLVPGFLISGLSFLFASGLYLKKRNDIWFYIIAGSTALNIGLNCWIIPKIGTKGAAITTLVCYLIQATITIYVSNRFVPVPFDIGSILRTLLCGAGMFTVLTYYMPDLGRAGLIVKVIAGALIYSLLLAVFEKEARELMWQVLGRRSFRSTSTGLAHHGDSLLVESKENEVAAGQ